MSRADVLVAPSELLAAGGRAVLLDVRWALEEDRGRERYLAGHVPGAVAAPRGLPRACEG